MPNRTLAVGDETTVVITDTNNGCDRDPVAQIDGVITFVRFPSGVTPEFGAAVRVRIADVAENNNVAVAIDP
jgi:predicted RNA-binding protein with TRAM domain